MLEGFIECLWLVFCCGIPHSGTEWVNAAEVYEETPAETWPILLPLKGTNVRRSRYPVEGCNTGLALVATLLVTVTEDVAF